MTAASETEFSSSPDGVDSLRLCAAAVVVVVAVVAEGVNVVKGVFFTIVSCSSMNLFAGLITRLDRDVTVSPPLLVTLEASLPFVSEECCW